jgi:hypothetical protein
MRQHGLVFLSCAHDILEYLGADHIHNRQELGSGALIQYWESLFTPTFISNM